MNDNKTSYREIMKATSFLGGVQVFLIIIGIIRSKIIAVLLGPSGMGFLGLLQSGTGVIAGLTNFGLSTSAIKDISSAFAEGDTEKIGRVVAVFRRLVWATGSLGLLVTLALSSFLSEITFGNHEYAWAFAVLSMTLLINQISTGQSVLLRSMRELKLMAKAAVSGSLLGLITSAPLYYVFGLDGIVPAILVSSILSLVTTWYWASHMVVKKVRIKFLDLKLEAKRMFMMGLAISFSGTLSLFFSYLLKLFIKEVGSVDDVGFYDAGFIILNNYVGMIFTVMASDYYPKLSSLSFDLDKMNEAINQQAEIAVLMLGPVVLMFMIFAKWLIVLLYSESFLPINSMLLLAAAGMIFKACSWSMSFSFLAQSSTKLFFWNELVSNLYMMSFNLIGYYFYGLTGLGASFLIAYLIYTFQVYILTKSRFGFKFSPGFLNILMVNLLVLTAFLFSSFFVDQNLLFYSIAFVLTLFSFGYNFKELNMRLAFLRI